MIAVLLNCSLSWSQNNSITHEIDSAFIPMDAIRIASAKMLELKYEKSVTKSLSEIVKNDSILINRLDNSILIIKDKADKDIKEVKKQRNIAIATGTIVTGILITIMILLNGK